MSDSTPAVFLSYAREDSDAARRIADALRAFGVEVWFDENELRGGDAWDQKIRTQIRECALFLPIVSANTQARREGYFRREWKLAVERTHDMAGGAAFLVPVGIDDTPQAAAVVPEEFLKVQWTRAAHGVAAPEFVRQVQRLLAAPLAGPATDGRKPATGRGDSARPRPAPKSLWALVVATTIIVAAVAIWKTRHPHAPGTAGAPVIVLMDSSYPNRVYDPVTLKSGEGNALSCWLGMACFAARMRPASFAIPSFCKSWNWRLTSSNANRSSSSANESSRLNSTWSFSASCRV